MNVILSSCPLSWSVSDIVHRTVTFPMASALFNSFLTHEAKAQGPGAGQSWCFRLLHHPQRRVYILVVLTFRPLTGPSTLPITLSQDRNVCHFQSTTPTLGSSLTKKQTNPNNSKIHSQCGHPSFESHLRHALHWEACPYKTAKALISLIFPLEVTAHENWVNLPLSLTIP